MAVLNAAFVALLTAALGCAASMGIAKKCVFWYRIPAWDGGAGYFVLLIALAGTVIGLAAGIATSVIVGTDTIPGFVKTLAYSVSSVLCLAAIGAFSAWAAADVPPTLDGHPINLVLEFRLPVDDADPSRYSPDKSYVAFSSIDPDTHVERRSQRGVLGVRSARKEGDQWILPASVSIFTSRGERTTMIVLDDKIRAGFVLPLPRRPGHEFDEWSEWLPRGKDGKTWPSTEVSYRFRVRPVRD